MKRWVAFLLCLFCLGLLGCGEKSEEGLKTVDQILSETAASQLTCSKYQLKKYTQPFWKNQIVYNETVMFIASADGSIPEKQLAFLHKCDQYNGWSKFSSYHWKIFLKKYPCFWDRYEKFASVKLSPEELAYIQKKTESNAVE